MKIELSKMEILFIQEALKHYKPLVQAQELPPNSVFTTDYLVSSITDLERKFEV